MAIAGSDGHSDGFRAAAIYTRISRDDPGRQTATGRQERLCRKWAADRGWEVAEVFEDVDRSAWNPVVVREGYEAMLDQIVSHRVDAVVVWRLDRLVRSPQEFERFWAACRVAGVQIHSVTEPVGGDDPVSLAIVRMLVTFAGLESDVKGIRIRARTRERAEQGLPHRGGVRCFGYTAGYTEIIQSEATELRNAGDRVLAGESPKTIAADWEGRGVPKIRDGTWSASQIRVLLMHPRYIGDRTYRGEVVATDCWPPIFERLYGAELRACVAGGLDRAQRRPNGTGLMRGLLRCGQCGSNLTSGGDRPNGTRRYCCDSRRGCGGVLVDQARLDTWILQRVLERIEARRTANHRTRWDRHQAGATIRGLDGLTDGLRELNKRYFVTADITYAEWVRARDDLTVATSQQLARDAPNRRPAGLPPGVQLWDVRSIWDELSPTARTQVITTELAYLTVNPAPDCNSWCPERLVPRWILPSPTGERPAGPRVKPDTIRWRTGADGRRWPARHVLSARELRSMPGPFDAPEASRMSGLCQQALRAHRDSGRLAVVTAGGRYYSHLAALDDLAAGTFVDDPRLTLAQAATYLGLDHPRLRSVLAEGELEFRKPRGGSRPTFTERELLRYLERVRVLPFTRGPGASEPVSGSYSTAREV